MRVGDEYQEYVDPKFPGPPYRKASHRWQILVSKYGIQRARCKSCPCFRTITKGSEKNPVTRYELGGKTFLKAPVCETTNV